jgi:hypothetical protein
MKKKKILLLLILIFYECSSFKIYAQQDSTAVKNMIFYQAKHLQLESNLLSINSIQIDPSNYQNLQPTQFTKDYNFKYLTYDPIRDPRRLVYNTGLCFGASLLDFAFLWSLPEDSTQWDKEKMRKEGMVKQWSNNLDAGPVWDEDGFFFNWITHPWAGAVYYMNARGSGFKRWESFVYSTLMSTLFWEFGVENFVEIPSWQDLIITPIIGSFIGEVFFIWKGKIIRNERNLLNSYFLGRVTLFVMDPFNELLDMFGYKTKNKKQIYSAIVPVSYDHYSKKNTLGIQVVLQF